MLAPATCVFLALLPCVYSIRARALAIRPDVRRQESLTSLNPKAIPIDESFAKQFNTRQPSFREIEEEETPATSPLPSLRLPTSVETGQREESTEQRQFVEISKDGMASEPPNPGHRGKRPKHKHHRGKEDRVVYSNAWRPLPINAGADTKEDPGTTIDGHDSGGDRVIYSNSWRPLPINTGDGSTPVGATANPDDPNVPHITYHPDGTVDKEGAYPFSSSSGIRSIPPDGGPWINPEGGLDFPVTLRSLITCAVPPIYQYLCFGPRVEVGKPTPMVQTKRKGLAFGYHNGVDVRMIKPLNIPMIEGDTDIGHHLGAVVDADTGNGAVEFGERHQVFKAWKMNNGGVVEWDKQGASVDVGSRASAADDAVRLRWTVAGVSVGPDRQLTRHGVGHAKAADYKAPANLSPIYPGYYARSGTDDWYRSHFRHPGDASKTAWQRACPWCFAVDGFGV